ncbi:GGDEF domain-containing protein [Sphingomonas sp. MMS24-JH45]
MIRDISARKSLEEQLTEEALTDPLTRLPNRRAFMKALAVRRDAAGPGATGCIALFDIDHFKRVNDTFGHAAGDKVLETFALTASRQLRGDDFVARLGGEEFAVLLPNADIRQAQAVCERVRRAVAAATTYCDEGEITITVSGGVASIQHDASVTLKIADDAAARRQDRRPEPAGAGGIACHPDRTVKGADLGAIHAFRDSPSPSCS